MAGGAPPQYSGSPVTPPYQGPIQQGPPSQQSPGSIPGHGTAPTGVVHGSVAGALNQGTPKAPAPSLDSPRTAHHQVSGKHPPPELHSGFTPVAEHLLQEDNRRQQRLRRMAEELRQEENQGAATQETGNQGDDNRANPRNARSQTNHTR